MDASALDPRLRASDDIASSSPTTSPTVAGNHHHGTSAFLATAQASTGSPVAATGHLQQQQHHPASHPTPYSTTSAAFTPETPTTATPGTVAGVTSTTHNNNHSHGTPPSAVSGPHGDGDDTPIDPNAPPGTDPKKPRACEACRGLKVRCEPDPTNPDGPCKRCAKAGRECLITQPTRKRQKKTDSRVAELEKKIDALTATLSATRGGGVAVGGGVGGPGQQRDEIVAHGLYGRPSMDWAGANVGSRDHSAPVKPAQTQSPFGGIGDGRQAAYAPPMVLAGQKRKHTETRDSASEDVRASPSMATSSLGQDTRNREYSDVVDRGVITMEKAAELFARYNEQMVPHLPGVVFPEGTLVSEIRKSKPLLFLAIMSAASSETPNTQRVLVKELMQIFAEKIIMTGEKSLELVQALHVAVIWYWPPEHFEELKFYQLVHIAAVMAIDIGLGRKKPGKHRRNIPYAWQDHPFRKHPPPDPTSIEARRCWLTSYFLTANTSMALHRPNLVTWTAFMTECMDVLESSPEAAPTDKYLCHLVWTHRLSEEVGIQFAMDDPNVFINIADARTQYALRGFERDLEKYRNSVPQDLHQPSLELGFHVLNLYMHEIALHVEAGNNKPQTLITEALREGFISDGPLTPAHINALSCCLTAIDGIFETFLSLDVTSIRCLPVFNLVRVAYATVVLIKMYFAATSPNSELGKVINKDNMKVEQHLEGLLEKFRDTAADDKSRPAAKFLVVLVMIRSWFQKQGFGSGDANKLRDGGATPGSQSREAGPITPAPPEYAATANTPLQLLSEIATHDQAAASNAASASANRSGRASNPPLHYSLTQMQPFMYDSAASGSSGETPSTIANTGTTPVPGTDAQQQFNGPVGPPMPWLNNSFNSDFDYASINGLTQAMDLTLAGLTDGDDIGGFDYGMRYVMGDPIFGGLVSDIPGANFNFQL